MSFHRILLTGACVLCTTTAFANGIKLESYYSVWPRNYFGISDYHNLDYSNISSRDTCNWANNAFDQRLSGFVKGYSGKETLSPMWLRNTDVWGRSQLMLCTDKEDVGFLSEIEKGLYDEINRSMVNKTLPRCVANHIVGIGQPQPQLGDETGRKHWKCTCQSQGCRWEQVEPLMECGAFVGRLKSGESRKNLLSINSHDDGWLVYQCGPSDDDTNPIIDGGDSTPSYVTYSERSCAKDVEFVVNAPQLHLGDSTGNKIWRCERVNGQWQWRSLRGVKACGVENIPQKGFHDTVALPQRSEPKYASGPQGDYTQHVFVRSTTYGLLKFGNYGYSYIRDMDPNDGTRLENADICVSSICLGGNDSDSPFAPNSDYTACVYREKQCKNGNKFYPIGYDDTSACVKIKPNNEFIATGYGPSEQLWKNIIKHSQSHEFFCDLYCTEFGWHFSVKSTDIDQPNPCPKGHELTADGLSCIDMSEFKNHLCEQSNGKINKKGECKCSIFATDAQLGNITIHDVQYSFCKTDKFDKSNAIDIFDEYIENDSSNINYSGGANAMSDAGDPTPDIPTLVANLSKIESEFGLSKWRTAEGKFNYARLASDATAGIVLGTTGALVTAHVVKKKQVEDGFESLECTVGGQHVGDWGDVFRIDGK